MGGLDGGEERERGVRREERGESRRMRGREARERNGEGRGEKVEGKRDRKRETGGRVGCHSRQGCETRTNPPVVQ